MLVILALTGVLALLLWNLAPPLTHITVMGARPRVIRRGVTSVVGLAEAHVAERKSVPRAGLTRLSGARRGSLKPDARSSSYQHPLQHGRSMYSRQQDPALQVSS